jgi:hypothetical protein
MADYFVTADGSSSLAVLEDQLFDEEGGASEFSDSQVSFIDGAMTNLWKFKMLEPGTLPPEATLQIQGTEPPTDKTLKWNGVMLVEGSLAAVDLYR